MALTSDILDVLAREDTTTQVQVLRQHQVLDTPAGDAFMGHLAGNYPERYSALIVALARGER